MATQNSGEFSVMLGQMEITEQRRIMEGKATPSGPPRTCLFMLGLVQLSMVLLPCSHHSYQVWGPTAKGTRLQNLPRARDWQEDTWVKFQTMSPAP